MELKSRKFNKNKQLGMDASTANGRLKKKIMFSLVQKLNAAICYQCKKLILSDAELSIEHKIPWLHSETPVELFFDLENIAFSHLLCNIGDARKPQSRHGTRNRYKKGCRCELCKEAVRQETVLYRAKRKEKTGKDR